MIRRSTTNGHDLLNEAEALLADIVERADSRADDINHRLAELEAEKTALGKVHILAGVSR